MASRTVTVTATSSAVAGYVLGVDEDVLVANTGTAVAYLDDEPQATSSSGLVLSAGSSVIWEKDTPLWVVAPSSTTLNITSNGGNLFDAGAIASQILSQGLAAQIATAINVAGVPAIDAPAVLLNTSQLVNAGVNPTDSGILDVQRYQSLRCVFKEVGVGFVAQNRQIQIGWFSDAAASTVVNYDLFSVPIETGGQVFVNAPCRGPYAVISAVSSAAGASTHSRYVLGSFRTVASCEYDVVGNGATYSSGFVAVGAEGLSGTFAMTGTFPIGNTVDYPLLHSGAAQFMTDTFAAAGATMIIQIRDELSNRFIFTKRFSAAAAVVANEPFILPNNAVSVRLAIAGAAVTGNLAIVSIDKP